MKFLTAMICLIFGAFIFISGSMSMIGSVAFFLGQEFPTSNHDMFWAFVAISSLITMLCAMRLILEYPIRTIKNKDP